MALKAHLVRYWMLVVALYSCGALLCAPSVHADLNAPAWYDEGAGVPDWHYRIPLTVPATAAMGSTVELDVDFNAQLAALNVDVTNVTFDPNSVRVVAPGGILVSRQEFTDAIFNGILDVTGNARGQVRFILQDAPGTGEYYLYFDIQGNGVKPTNPAAVINGHFELSAGTTPSGWTTSSQNAGGRENNEVQTTSLGQTLNLAAGCGSGGANGLNISPNNIGANATGRRWHLLGFRDQCENGSGSEEVRLSRSISVPAGSAAGELEFYFQVQSFDGISNNNNYDWFEFSVNGATVNHRALGINNSTNPTLRIDNQRLGRSGYGNSLLDFGWKRARLNLSPYAGSTITFRIQSRHSASDNQYRSWIKIDDVVWSRQLATLGEVEGYGVNITTPNDTTSAPPSEYRQGDTIQLQATVDVDVAAVVAQIYDNNDLLVGANIALFDDGTHGDPVADDNIWHNDGSDAADPTYTISAGPFGLNWRVLVMALDASIAANGATDGLLLRPAAPDLQETQLNYYNIDEQLFTVRGAQIDLAKNLQTLQDGISPSQPKSIPGAWVRYEVRVENQGPDGLDNNSVIIVDEIPTEVAVCVVAACTCSGLGCIQRDPVYFDDSTSPISTGLTYDYATQVEYSTDGVNYSYVPQPDAEGFDANVRYVRVRPQGAMNQPNGNDNAQFEINYVVRLE